MSPQLDRIEQRLKTIEEVLMKLLDALEEDDGETSKNSDQNSLQTLENLDDNPCHYQSL